MKTKITLFSRFETAVFILFLLLFTSLEALSQALIVDAPTKNLSLDSFGSVFFDTSHDPFTKNDMIPLNPKSPDGVYYMVQVGAYQNPVTADLYPNFGPLISHELANGMTRYLVGYFRDYQDAVKARNQMVRTPGYERSFVVAYNHSNSVSLGYAWKIQRHETLNNANLGLDVAKKANPIKIDIPEEMIEIPGLRYYVHLGEFKNDVPQSFANAIILASEHAMITETSRGETTVFHTEAVSSLMNAIQLSDFLVNEGISSSRIVAEFDGNEISLVDAAKIRSGEIVNFQISDFHTETMSQSTNISMHIEEISDTELDAILKRGGR